MGEGGGVIVSMLVWEFMFEHIVRQNSVEN